MNKKYILTTVIMGALVAGLPGLVQAQSFNAVPESGRLETAAPAQETVPGSIKATLDTLDVREMDIQEVLKRVAFQSGLEIVTDEDISGRVTIFLKNVDVFDALRIILDTNNLAYDRQEATVHVMTAKSFESRFGYSFSRKIQTRIIPLVNARSDRVAALLNTMKSDAGKVIYSDGTKSFILMDAPEQLKSMSEFIREMDVPVETRTFELRHVKGKDMAVRVQEFLTKNVGRMEFGDREELLTIEDTPARIVEIAGHIDEMDKPDRDVLFEVKILQIILNDENRRGVDWEAIVSDYQSLRFGGFDDRESGLLSVGTVSEEDYQVLLDALDTVGMLNTVSNLKMTAGVNGRNEILIRSRDLLADVEPQEPQEGVTAQGEVLYSVVSSFGSKQGTKPEPDNQIVLDLQPEVIGQSAGEKKSLTLKLHEGTTVVIGGLFKQVRVEAMRKIPLLGDLPLLGFAFRMQGQRFRETEIIVFLTPKVIVKEQKE